MLVDMTLLLTSADKSLMVVITADASAFKPVSAVELLKFLYLDLRKRARMQFLKN